MKAIVCELCGGNELLKQDGLFVCQNCGTKYTLEEAKKLFIEGTVNVKVDRSSEIENILRNADATFEDKNYKEAFELYNKALNINADDPHAILYRALSSAWQSTVKDCRIVELNNASKRAFEKQWELSKDDHQKYFTFCADALAKVSNAVASIVQLYVQCQ